MTGVLVPLTYDNLGTCYMYDCRRWLPGCGARKLRAIWFWMWIRPPSVEVDARRTRRAAGPARRDDSRLRALTWCVRPELGGALVAAATEWHSSGIEGGVLLCARGGVGMRGLLLLLCLAFFAEPPTASARVRGSATQCLL